MFKSSEPVDSSVVFEEFIPPASRLFLLDDRCIANIHAYLPGDKREDNLTPYEAGKHAPGAVHSGLGAARFQDPGTCRVGWWFNIQRKGMRLQKHAAVTTVWRDDLCLVEGSIGTEMYTFILVE